MANFYNTGSIGSSTVPANEVLLKEMQQHKLEQQKRDMDYQADCAMELKQSQGKTVLGKEHSPADPPDAPLVSTVLGNLDSLNYTVDCLENDMARLYLALFGDSSVKYESPDRDTTAASADGVMGSTNRLLGRLDMLGSRLRGAIAVLGA
jgi:hypothetical protein